MTKLEPRNQRALIVTFRWRTRNIRVLQNNFRAIRRIDKES